MTRGRVEVQVWRMEHPDDPVLRTRAAPERDGHTAHLSIDGTTLTTLDESGSVRRWTLDPAGLQAQLWSRTPTCGGRPDETDIERYCACESCLGRNPAICSSESNIETLAVAAICPGD